MNKLKILEQILKGNVDLIEGFSDDLPSYLNDEIVIKPAYIRNMLKRFLNKSINADEINKWASFICGRGEYVVPGGDNDEITDFYEDMYYVIQRLSTPEIDGEINEISIKSYLVDLEKYHDDFA